ncbi:MAG: hypothetical protein N2Z79_04725, partial [Candidatus Omnitrophica bacterium]|nr:hypothetical protein [Candidatus Omnitrophota bacterium]
MILPIAVPILGAFLTLLVPRNFKGAFSVLLLGLTFVFSFSLKARGFLGYVSSPYLLDWLNISFIFDKLSIFMAVSY